MSREVVLPVVVSGVNVRIAVDDDPLLIAEIDADDLACVIGDRVFVHHHGEYREYRVSAITGLMDFRLRITMDRLPVQTVNAGTP